MIIRVHPSTAGDLEGVHQTSARVGGNPEQVDNI